MAANRKEGDDILTLLKMLSMLLLTTIVVDANYFFDVNDRYLIPSWFMIE